jgi:hypothetical protein
MDKVCLNCQGQPPAWHTWEEEAVGADENICHYCGTVQKGVMEQKSPPTWQGKNHFRKWLETAGRQEEQHSRQNNHQVRAIPLTDNVMKKISDQFDALEKYYLEHVVRGNDKNDK